MFVEYLGRAKGSCGELRAQTYIARDVSYLSEDEFTQVMLLAEKCGRQLHGFMQYLKRSDRQPS